MKIILDAKQNENGYYEYIGINQEFITKTISEILIGIDKTLINLSFNKEEDNKNSLIKYSLIKEDNDNIVRYKSVIINALTDDIFISVTKQDYRRNVVIKNDLVMVKENYTDYNLFEFDFKLFFDSLLNNE